MSIQCRALSSFVLLALAGIATPGCTEDVTPAEPNLAVSSASGLSRVAGALARSRGASHAGTIFALRLPGERGEAGRTMLFANLTEGPNLRDQLCTRKISHGCEVQMCESKANVVETPTTVGTIRFEGSHHSFELVPQTATSYKRTLVEETLWDSWSDHVTVSYNAPRRSGAKIRLEAPATTATVSQNVPDTLSRARGNQGPVVRWDLPLKWKNDSEMVVHLTATEPVANVSGGFLPRAAISCFASSNRGEVQIDDDLIRELPAGSYFATTQAESTEVDANGIEHTLSELLPDSFKVVTVQ